MIVNTAGWDTDCNAGNVGCLLGIKNGLAGTRRRPGLARPGRRPACTLLRPTAARAITDAVIEAQALVVAGHRLAGAAVPAAPKNGARFHFSFPGSLQGFACETGEPAKLHPLTVENAGGQLAIGFRRLAAGRVARVSSPTFFGKDGLTMPTYQMVACPTLYSGQTVKCHLAADVLNGSSVSVRLYASVFGAGDALTKIHGEPRVVDTQADVSLTWRLPDTGGYPIFDIGLEIEAQDFRGVDGTLSLDWLHWDGAPDVTFRRPDLTSEMWKHAWMNDVSQLQTRWEPLRATSSEGLGMLAQGTRDWRDYEVASTLTPLLAEAWGLAAESKAASATTP